MTLNWTSVLGTFKQEGTTLIIEETTERDVEGKLKPLIGNYLCNRRFDGGTITADIQFKELSEISSCEFILFYDPATKWFVTAGLGSAAMMYAIRDYSGSAWGKFTVHQAAGDRKNLEQGRIYHAEVSLMGSQVSLTVDGIQVLVARLPFPLNQSHVGIWAFSEHEIRVTNFTVNSETPNVFVVMQFTPPYNELYADVIKPTCDELGLAAIRADEAYGPGVIIADMAVQIVRSKIIIAEISPANPNVYYEVGYAHALGKPTILIAEKDTVLPFDVSPFRVLFYEDSIAGKAKIQEGLTRHLQAILTPQRRTLS